MQRLQIAFAVVVASASAVSIAGAIGCGPTQRPDGGQGLLAAGAQAPALTKVAHNGQSVSLQSSGSPLIVYFYPKDATPGCTKEACAFRDAWSKYESAGVLVVGVSGDDDASHRAFAEEHSLPFPLIADEDGAWSAAFGVSTTAGMPKRVSFLVDAHGKIAHVYPDVDPGVHASEVLADVAKLSS